MKFSASKGFPISPRGVSYNHKGKTDFVSSQRTLETHDAIHARTSDAKLLFEECNSLNFGDMHSFEDSAAIIIQNAIRRVFKRKEDLYNSLAKFSNEEENENYRLLYSLYLCHKDDDYWGPYYEYACFLSRNGLPTISPQFPFFDCYGEPSQDGDIESSVQNVATMLFMDEQVVISDEIQNDVVEMGEEYAQFYAKEIAEIESCFEVERMESENKEKVEEAKSFLKETCIPIHFMGTKKIMEFFIKGEDLDQVYVNLKVFDALQNLSKEEQGEAILQLCLKASKHAMKHTGARWCKIERKFSREIVEAETEFLYFLGRVEIMAKVKK